MKLLGMSDIHLEFHPDHGTEFSENVPTGVDVNVIAGDLGLVTGEHYVYFQDFIDHITDRNSESGPEVVFVAGNHEYYHSSFLKAREQLQILTANPRFHYLDRDTVELHGRRFVGATMWFPEQTSHFATWKLLNDFYQIERFRKEVYEENRRDVAFLRETVQEGDIVVTHHIPSYAFVHPQYKYSAMNSFFVCDVSDLFRRSPKMWIFGHTHESYTGLADRTLVVCNPYGYQTRDINEAFRLEVMEING